MFSNKVKITPTRFLLIGLSLITFVACGAMNVSARQLKGLALKSSSDSKAAAVSPVAITFTATFAGAGLIVDGNTIAPPTVVYWTPGTSHTINLSTPQYVSTTSWIFSGWSTGGGGNAKSQTVLAPSSPKTYRANFQPQYKLSRNVTPASGGGVVTASPSSPDGYYWPSQSVSLTATPASGCMFGGFSGNITSSKPVVSVPMKSPMTVNALFTCTQVAPVPVTVQSGFSGGKVIVDGAAFSSPAVFSWVPGSSHTLNLNTPQYLGTMSWIFNGWSDGVSGVSHSITVPAGGATYTAAFVPQYELTTTASPTTGGTITLNPTSPDGYYWPTQSVQMTASPGKNCRFVQFSGDTTGAAASVTVAMTSARNVTAQFYCTTVPNGNTPAQQADNFVDTIGVNVHLHYTGTPYADNFPMIQQQLVALGVRHIRDGLIDTQWQGYYDHLNALGNLGIKANFVTAVGQSAPLLTAYPSRVSSAFESYEGPNEYDNSGDPNWPSTLRSFQQMLYTTVKGNASTANFPVLAPTVTSQQAYTSVGDLSAFMDFGSLHNYFAARNPGTGGWGDNGYGSIQWNVAASQPMDAKKPLYTTETGYTNSNTSRGLPELVSGRYAPRVYLEQFNAGIVRTYMYELIDQTNDPTNDEMNFGLLEYSGAAKPSFTSLQNVITLLEDPGPSFAVGGLTYTLSGNTANVHQSLLQKRNGTLYLLLWIEQPSYDVNAQQMLTVAPQVVTVQVGQSTGTPMLYTLADTGIMTPSSLTFGANNSLALTLSDHVTVVALPAPSN